MGSVGDCFGNAMAESFWPRMQVELGDRKRWHTRVEPANAIFEYLEIWHNRQRRHTSLGTLTPAEFEARHQHKPAARIQQSAPTEPRDPHSQRKTQGESGFDGKARQMRMVLAGVLALVLIAALMPVRSAGAYTLLGEGCRYDPDNDDDGLGIGFQKDNDLYDEDEELAIQYAASAWNGAMDPQFTIVSHSSFDRDLAVRWANLGPNVGGALTYGCGSDHYWTDPVFRFGANATFYTPTMRRRKAIAIHEIGHSYGLQHNNTSGCNSSTASLMHVYPVSKYDLCGWHRPTQDSVDGATAAHEGDW